MLFLAGLLLRLLAFGLITPAFSLKFDFTSVQQCAPLLLSFSELTSPLSETPTCLTFVPFNSTTTVVPLHDINFSAGIAINFLPFDRGSEFIVSLDDANGNSVISNSDIFPVLSAPHPSSTCIPKHVEHQPKIFTMASPVVSQCQNFTINYDTTMTSQAPRVRLYNPGGPSFLLNKTSDNPGSGVATYAMAFSFGSGIVLTMDNGNGTTETTPLLLVGGDSSSPSACLSKDRAITNSALDSSIGSEISTGTSPSTYRIIAISSAVIGGLAVLFGILLSIFILRNHRRRECQERELDRIVPSQIYSHDEKHTIPQMIVLDDSSLTQSDNNSDDDMYKEKGHYDGTGLSWSPTTVEDHVAWSETKQSPPPASSLFDPVATVPQPPLLPPRPLARALSKRHLRAPSDVPADLNSGVWSTVSFYPVISASTVETPTLSRERSLNGRSVGLPTSPRDGLKPTLSRSPSGNASTQGRYGG